MPKFDFRLRFNLPESYRIASDAEELDLIVDSIGHRIYLKSGATNTPIKDHARAAVRGGPFESEQEAYDAAERSKRALLFWAVGQRTGIDFGDGRQRSIATHAGLRMLEEQYGVPFRNDKHGIDVFEPLEKLSFVHSVATARVGKYPPNLVSTFIREYPNKVHVSEKQMLACEIYASSFFDISQRSRFITLITAVEALLEPARRSDPAQSLVDELFAKTEAGAVDEATRASIKGSLEWLRSESISQAGRALTNSLLPDKLYDGKSASAFFTMCYELRSKIVHRGTAGNDVDVWQLASLVEEFVAHLLIASLGTAWPKAPSDGTSGGPEV
jgi:hypothetical protein